MENFNWESLLNNSAPEDIENLISDIRRNMERPSSTTENTSELNTELLQELFPANEFDDTPSTSRAGLTDSMEAQPPTPESPTSLQSRIVGNAVKMEPFIDLSVERSSPQATNNTKQFPPKKTNRKRKPSAQPPKAEKRRCKTNEKTQTAPVQHVQNRINVETQTTSTQLNEHLMQLMNNLVVVLMLQLLRSRVFGGAQPK